MLTELFITSSLIMQQNSPVKPTRRDREKRPFASGLAERRGDLALSRLLCNALPPSARHAALKEIHTGSRYSRPVEERTLLRHSTVEEGFNSSPLIQHFNPLSSCHMIRGQRVLTDLCEQHGYGYDQRVTQKDRNPAMQMRTGISGSVAVCSEQLVP